MEGGKGTQELTGERVAPAEEEESEGKGGPPGVAGALLEMLSTKRLVDDKIQREKTLGTLLRGKLSIANQNGVLCALVDGKRLGTFQESELVRIRWFRRGAASAPLPPAEAACGNMDKSNEEPTPRRVALKSSSNGFYRLSVLDTRNVVEAEARTVFSPEVIARAEIGPIQREREVEQRVCAVLGKNPVVFTRLSLLESQQMCKVVLSIGCSSCAATASASPPRKDKEESSGALSNDPSTVIRNPPGNSSEDGLWAARRCEACGAAMGKFLEIVPVEGKDQEESPAPQQSVFSFHCASGAGRGKASGIDGTQCSLKVVLDDYDPYRLTLVKTSIAFAGSLLSESVLLSTAQADARQLLVAALMSAFSREAGTRGAQPPLVAFVSSSQEECLSDPGVDDLATLAELCETQKLRIAGLSVDANKLRADLDLSVQKREQGSQELVLARARVATLEREKGQLDQCLFEATQRLRVTDSERRAYAERVSAAEDASQRRMGELEERLREQEANRAEADARARRAEAEVAVLAAKNKLLRASSDRLGGTLARLSAAAAPALSLMAGQDAKAAQGAASNPSEEGAADLDVDAVERLLQQAATLRAHLAAREAEKLDLIHENTQLRKRMGPALENIFGNLEESSELPVGVSGDTVTARYSDLGPSPARRSSNLIGAIAGAISSRRGSYAGQASTTGQAVGNNGGAAPLSLPHKADAKVSVQVNQLRALANSLMESVKEKEDLLNEQRYANKVLADKLQDLEREAARWRR